MAVACGLVRRRRFLDQIIENRLEVLPVVSLDDPDAPAVRPVRQDAQPTPLGMTYALIPGAGGSAWYWHRVAPLLPDAIAIDLPTTIRRT